MCYINANDAGHNVSPLYPQRGKSRQSAFTGADLSAFNSPRTHPTFYHTSVHVWLCLVHKNRKKRESRDTHRSLQQPGTHI